MLCSLADYEALKMGVFFLRDPLYKEIEVEISHMTS